MLQNNFLYEIKRFIYSILVNKLMQHMQDTHEVVSYVIIYYHPGRSNCLYTHVYVVLKISTSPQPFLFALFDIVWQCTRPQRCLMYLLSKTSDAERCHVVVNSIGKLFIRKLIVKCLTDIAKTLQWQLAFFVPIRTSYAG